MQKKVILLTGASSGIGYSTAQALARQGHKVYGAARRVELMEPLRADGVVTDADSMSEGVRRVMEAEGRIDVLINNAGFGYFGPVETVAMEEARRQVEVNVFGLAELCKLVIPIMRSQGSGRIINTSSIAGKLVLYFGGWYHVSKYSVEALSDALRMELRPFGIDVSMIEPGGIRTDWGIIAARHLAESAAGTAYEEAALNESHNLDWAYRSSYLSRPEVVTRAILRAVNNRRPRARYRIGRFSKVGVMMHSILPARWWDSLMRQMGRIKVNAN